MTFIIIVTGYNCKEFTRQCYEGIIDQEYKDWRAVFVDDGSTDGNGELLTEIVKHPQCFIEKHYHNLGAAKRRSEAIKKYAKPLDVVVLHGMDDVLFPDCLSTIVMQYYDGKWMTYGNWVSQHGKKLPPGFLNFDPVISMNRDYRKDIYRSTGPNTFYTFLFNRIPEADFLIDGKWIDSTTESEVMFSALEMCGEKRIGIIERPICLYRENLPNGSLNRLGRDYKYEILAKIKARPKRDLLNDNDFGK